MQRATPWRGPTTIYDYVGSCHGMTLLFIYNPSFVFISAGIAFLFTMIAIVLART
jgi:ABC-type bacteriocin/lantibiotic exporter with double-glycine peptidase domain